MSLNGQTRTVELRFQLVPASGAILSIDKPDSCSTYN